MYKWYGDRVERREWCRLASPLGHRTQPWLGPASESSGPLRFQATRASTPDFYADCESCVAPDSPNLSKRDVPRQTDYEHEYAWVSRRLLLHVFLFRDTHADRTNTITNNHVGRVKFAALLLLLFLFLFWALSDCADKNRKWTNLCGISLHMCVPQGCALRWRGVCLSTSPTIF